MAVNKISLRIGGPAGRGIMNTGLMFAKCCSRIGLHVFDYIEYPSLIKGGHNTYVVRAEDEPIYCQVKGTDILIALDEPSIHIHREELNAQSIVIYDEKAVHENIAGLSNCHRIPLPMKELLQEAHGKELMANTVCLGAALGIMDYPLAVAEGVVRDAFGEKKDAIVEENLAALRLGFTYAREHFAALNHYRLTPIPNAPKRMVLTGNEAIALGAVSAGLTFYAAYPMTPASSILHTLAGWQERHNIVVKHAEDEISVANMTVGAAFAGARAMCATSGGGFALMNETLSLAGITETPAVFVEVTRGGPGTGIPTFTEQSDLKFVLNSGHGDFPLFVVAPGDVEEAFRLTGEAFNAAERYHTPTVILSDKYLGESHKSAEFFNERVPIDRGPLLREAPEHYLRYPLDGRAVTPRTIPGVPNGFFLANSDEHDPFGYSTEEIDIRNAQMEKRMRKLEEFAREMPQPVLRGPPLADLTIISWGSTKGPIMEALKHLEREGLSVNFLHLTWIQPFPRATVRRILSNAKRTLIIENNYSGQMQGVIKEQTGIDIQHAMRRYDGRPFFFEDICSRVKDILRGGQ
ncbi:2-oxoacid:acceptor oxidoreductase subunit alpha [Candidatus Woesearchaeota archaeon]|nr:MAG: 2-oxoacid:acceptor oxidoreductase subunit alpha [Candidatus Woesearchaeota archaeon]